MIMYFAGAVKFDLPLWLSLPILGFFILIGIGALVGSLGVLLGLKNFWQGTNRAENNSPSRLAIYANHATHSQLMFYKKLRMFSIAGFFVGVFLVVANSKGNFATANDFLNSLSSQFSFHLALVILSVFGFFYANVKIRKLFS